MQTNKFMKITAPHNDEPQEHGQWLNIGKDGVIIFQGMFINGLDLGYWIESKNNRAYYAR